MKRAWIVCTVVLFLAMHAFGQAGRPDNGRSLMERAEQTYRAGLTDEVVEAAMHLESFDPRTRHGLPGGRDYRIRRTVQYGPTSREDKVLVRFLAQDEGTWFLSLGRAEGDDEQHFKQRDARRARRLKAGESEDPFYGTDFTNGDLRPEKIEAYDYRVMRTEQFDGRPCTVVEAIPQTVPGPKGYGKREFWVHEIAEGVLVYLQIQYYDIRGVLWKTQQNLGFVEVDHEHFPGISRPAVTTMEDTKIHHRTELIYDVATRRLNPGVEEVSFDPRKLAEER